MQVPNIQHLQTSNRLQVINPLTGQTQWEKKVTPNFTVEEWYTSTKAFKEEKLQLQKDGIPLDNSILQAPQVVRNYTGEPVYIGSSYRTQKWEIHKNRSADGDHPKGKGVDLNGKNVVEMIERAVNEKNALYRELSKLGINAIGFYSWGVHLGKREPKPNGKLYLWDYRNVKKKAITNT